MGRQRNNENIEPIDNKKQEIQLLSFETAFSRYKKAKPERAMLMKDKEAVMAFVMKRLASQASQEDFNKVLDRY
jgi:hypothetical protein